MCSCSRDKRIIELRAQQVIIETPRLGAEPFIAVVIQRVIFDADGVIAQTINRERMLNSSLSSRALKIYTVRDPVIGEHHDNNCLISIAGIGAAIEDAVRAWILEEYPESYLKDNRVLIDDGNSKY